MGELLKKPYEISIWETKNNDLKSINARWQEIKVAVIGTDKMTSPNRAFSPILTKRINGEITLTFSMAHKYYDELADEIVTNPFIKYLVNERIVKLKYEDEWYEFKIKNCTESSESEVFEYTCVDAFVNELSKVGYNITLSTDLNNNQGTALELGEKALEGTDWKVDWENSDLLQQTVKEPTYSCAVIEGFQALNLDTNEVEDIQAEEIIFIFYSYIANQDSANIQFIREADSADFKIDDDGVIIAPNYRIIGDASIEDWLIFINDTCSIDIGGILTDNQAYRLVYGQLTTYDPVVGRTVNRYTAAVGNEEKEVYQYTDFEYSTSEVLTSYVTNGSDFNIYADGSIQGWGFNTPTSVEEDGHMVLRPMKLITSPEISTTTPLVSLRDFTRIDGYLQLNFGGTYDEYKNTYFNDGIMNNAAIIDHISRGQEYVLRVRAGVKDDEGIIQPVTMSEHGIRAVIAYYTEKTEECYYQDKLGTYTLYNIDGVIVDFNQPFEVKNNIISGGIFSTDFKSYIIDDVVQTPSSKYLYTADDEDYYIWDSDNQVYVLKTELTSYMNYYMTTAAAVTAVSNSVMADPTTKIGIFLYTDETNLVDVDVCIEEIQITKLVRDANDEPVLIGNVPAAVSVSTDYFYLKPDKHITKDEIEIFTSKDALADELGIPSNYITPIYNEDCEKVLSISAEKSNCFNILQTICETFECWLKIEVPHTEDGYLKYVKNNEGYDSPSKKVAFKKYAGKDNYAGFKYGINLNSITRTVNSDEIVTKLIVASNPAEYTKEGTISIQSAKTNPSGEAYIINFDHYLNMGLLYDKTSINEDLNFYNEQLKSHNTQIHEYEAERARLVLAIEKLKAKRNVISTLLSEAKKELNEALVDFQDLTKISYDTYVNRYNTVDEQYESMTEEERKEFDNLVENDTIVELIGKIYTCSTVINNYTGILTNIDIEYKELRLKYYGAQEYSYTTSTVADDGTNIATRVTVSDYIDGFSFSLIDSENTILNYEVTPNQKTFEVYQENSKPFVYLRLNHIPAHYKVIHAVNNEIEREISVGSRIRIYDTDNSHGMIQSFRLVPEPSYAAMYRSYDEIIDELLESKKSIEDSFYTTYSQFIQEGTWGSTDYIDPELYYLDGLQVSTVAAHPKVTYDIRVMEVSELSNLSNYLFDIGDKTYMEDTEFFGYYNKQIGDEIFLTPIQEEVIVSEVVWNLDEPEKNTIAVQNFKTQFEDLFHSMAATVQAVQYNEPSYARAASILDENGIINSALLQNSLNNLDGGYDLTLNGTVVTTDEGLLIRNLTKPENLVKIISEGIKISTDGGQTWKSALTAEGIALDSLTAGSIDTQQILIKDGDNPSFRWDKAGINAYGFNPDNDRAPYDLKTYVRFDKYGLYGIKDGEDFVANSLEDIKDEAHFGVTWDGFFIKNSYTGGGKVQITSDNDIQVINSDQTEKIKIGALEWKQNGQTYYEPIDGVAPSLYGIRINNNAGETVFKTGDDGNITVTGTINALAGVFTGTVNAQGGVFSGNIIVGDPEGGYITIDGSNEVPFIASSDYIQDSGRGWFIDSDGKAIFNDVSVRGSIKTSVFEYEEIQAVGGAFLFRPSTTIREAEIEPGQEGADYDDLRFVVEKGGLFQVGDWVKISNLNTTDESTEPDELNGYGLTYIYEVIEATHNGIVLRGAAEVLDDLDISVAELVGGSLISMGKHATLEIPAEDPEEESTYIDVPGNNNYGIGINSSDGFINLPPRAISLFETVIHPNSSVKVSYQYRGILGTLPDERGINLDVRSSIYPYMRGTQGIYTDNMYIGDSNQYLAFYTDTDDLDDNNQPKRKLKISTKEMVFEYDPETGEEITWEDRIDEEIDEQIPIQVRIDSTAGDLFVHRTISTKLICRVYKGNEDITNQVLSFTWQKKDKNGVLDENWHPPIGTRDELEIGSSDVDSKAIFICTVQF